MSDQQSSFSPQGQQESSTCCICECSSFLPDKAGSLECVCGHIAHQSQSQWVIHDPGTLVAYQHRLGERCVTCDDIEGPLAVEGKRYPDAIFADDIEGPLAVETEPTKPPEWPLGGTTHECHCGCTRFESTAPAEPHRRCKCGHPSSVHLVSSVWVPTFEERIQRDLRYRDLADTLFRLSPTDTPFLETIARLEVRRIKLKRWRNAPRPWITP